ncbi:unnamed protein product [Bemisia tabaci]|uniref:Activator of basal transcription 1 n=1 Tax=Bemisia tabaci TaxID=7038 RepID=A0A9P0AHH6_BEMTA|nr:unnamed protein product [Bemisia tabaci]
MDKEEEAPAKRRSKGIVYLSTIPKYMTVTKLRELLEVYGKIGRIFLQPAKNPHSKKKKPSKHFEEGWVEFLRKKHAKQVAAHLNNKLIGGRKRSKFYDCMWNIKYLPRFKWVHLCERLAYERAVQKQKQRLVVAQAKREATSFALNVDRSERLSKKKNKRPTAPAKEIEYKQRKTEGEILSSKKKTKSKPVPATEDRKEFIKNLFS